MKNKINNTESFMNGEERIIFALRSLYSRFGYRQYRMSKFEEYDLYVRNKDFLISDSVITFTDRNGKLMALKPDVTLSIVKNTRGTAGTVQKLCYNENVYRTNKGGDAYAEIVQAGLECIGKIDPYCVGEVLTLAAGSLDVISDDFLLDISHLGLITSFIDDLSIPLGAEIMKLISGKNIHGIRELCSDLGVSAEKTESFCELISIYGAPAEVMARVRELSEKVGACEACDELESAVRVLTASEYGDRIRIDFSVVGDTHYYNGIVFKGFINGIPDSVLSGGRYDGLMRRMKRQDGAIGFAVYLDLLERVDESVREYDVDTLLIYGDEDEPADVIRAAERMTALGETVLVSRAPDDKTRYRRIINFRNCEVTDIE